MKNRSENRFAQYLAGLALTLAAPGVQAAAHQPPPRPMSVASVARVAPNIAEKLAPTPSPELAFQTGCIRPFCQVWVEYLPPQSRSDDATPTSALSPSAAFALATRS